MSQVVFSDPSSQWGFQCCGRQYQALCTSRTRVLQHTDCTLTGRLSSSRQNFETMKWKLLTQSPFFIRAPCNKKYFNRSQKRFSKNYYVNCLLPFLHQNTLFWQVTQKIQQENIPLVTGRFGCVIWQERQPADVHKVAVSPDANQPAGSWFHFQNKAKVTPSAYI